MGISAEFGLLCESTTSTEAGLPSRGGKYAAFGRNDTVGVRAKHLALDGEEDFAGFAGFQQVHRFVELRERKTVGDDRREVDAAIAQ